MIILNKVLSDNKPSCKKSDESRNLRKPRDLNNCYNTSMDMCYFLHY